jgi:ankyrin repeat protein
MADGPEQLQRMLELRGQQKELPEQDTSDRLIGAVNWGRLDAVQELILQGADINRWQMGGKTPLHWASKNHSVPIMELLIAHGADIMAKDDAGRTPLHFAVSDWLQRDEATQATRCLLEHGADPAERDAEGNTPLHVADGGLPVMQLLLDRGSDINEQNGQGRTPLHEFAYRSLSSGRSEEAVAFLIEHGAQIEAVDNERQTALHVSVAEYLNGGGCAQVLIQAGASIEARDLSLRAPIHTAVACHCVAGLEQLVALGAGINARDGDGQTPLGIILTGPDEYWFEDYGPWDDNYSQRMTDMADLLKRAGGVI